MAIEYIYALVDPRSVADGWTWLSATRYVGKTRNIIRRFHRHLAPSQLLVAEKNTYKSRWIRSLLSSNLKPYIYVLSEVHPPEDPNDVERYWISLCRRIGARLTNGTDGGDGGNTHLSGRRLSEEAKRKCSEAQKGRKWAPDDPRREQIRMRQFGQPPWHATKRAIEKNTMVWRVVEPDGTAHVVEKLKAFCVEHGLSYRKMCQVARGDEGRSHHCGWRCSTITQREPSKRDSTHADRLAPGTPYAQGEGIEELPLFKAIATREQASLFDVSEDAADA